MCATPLMAEVREAPSRVGEVVTNSDVELQKVQLSQRWHQPPKEVALRDKPVKPCVNGRLVQTAACPDSVGQV